jgi:hypothetical protein
MFYLFTSFSTILSFHILFLFSDIARRELSDEMLRTFIWKNSHLTWIYHCDDSSNEFEEDCYILEQKLKCDILQPSTSRTNSVLTVKSLEIMKTAVNQ